MLERMRSFTNESMTNVDVTLNLRPKTQILTSEIEVLIFDGITLSNADPVISVIFAVAVASRCPKFAHNLVEKNLSFARITTTLPYSLLLSKRHKP